MRVTAPNDYGVAVVIPVITACAACYPALKVELMLGDEIADLMSGEIDIAVRVGWLPDSSLQARRIGSFRQLLVGSPALSARIAAAREPEDLAGFPFIANMALREPLLWQFSRGERDHRAVRMRAAITIDTTPGVLAGVQAGGGLSVLPDFLVRDLLASGQLVEAIPEWRLPSGGIHAVCPAAKFRPAKVKAFLVMLTEAERQR